MIETINPIKIKKLIGFDSCGKKIENSNKKVFIKLT